jgi:fibronectin type 3 domain-containing protein
MATCPIVRKTTIYKIIAMITMQAFKTSYRALAASILLVLSTGFAHAQTARAVAGPKGIWIICGDKLPKNFSYKIFRQKPNADWVTIASIKMPASKEEVQGNILNISRLTGFNLPPLSNDRLEALWQRIAPATATESPFEIESDFTLRAAIGTAWYDATADSLATYSYKVQMLDKNGEATDMITEKASYPGKKFGTVIKPVLIKPSKAGTYGEFEIATQDVMTRCKIYRGYYLHSGYQEISASPLFVTRKKVLYVTFTDDSATEKVPYTYILVPIDAAGNAGEQSPELRAFNVTEKTIIPSVTNFRTQSVTAKKAIRLSWHLPKTQQLASVDLYKSDVYDGKYVKIGALGATDTTYMDFDVQPIHTYYYSIRLTGIYESSPMSPRTPGILKASNKNEYPPQNFRVLQRDREVTLIFDRGESDTHAYYVYRADGLKTKMQQIGRPIISDSSRITYTDTLPMVTKPTVFVYAVADENTSYAISPRTKPVFVYVSGSGILPIPHDVLVRKTDAGKIQVIWPDLRKELRTILGYRLYKRMSNEGKDKLVMLSKTVIPAANNSYIDSAEVEGTAFYSVRTVSEDGTTLSSPSLESGITVHAELPNNVANIKAFASGNTIELSWNNPMGQPLKAIKIYRAPEGKAAVEIATLDATKEAYSDKDVKADGVYYYTFVVEDSKGNKSTVTEPLGIHL